jgi:hypothetical protein
MWTYLADFGHPKMAAWERLIDNQFDHPYGSSDYQFPICNTKWLKNGKLCKAILSALYNISQRNFGILLILWSALLSCDEIFVQTCLDQNFTQKGKGLFIVSSVSSMIPRWRRCQHGKGGGVCLYVRSNINYKRRYDLQSEILEKRLQNHDQKLFW